MMTRYLFTITVFLTAGASWAMDRAREELRADKAAAEFKATGEGVLVAIMDRGIDWLNDDFRNEDGSTRIKYIFDLTDDKGAKAPNNPYKVGTIYTEEQINRALKGGPKLATRDAVGHGTTTTGIACGSGRNSPNRKYRGIAPKASIICVKITGGATSHTDQIEEPYFFDMRRIPIAIDFIRDKALELRMPCVMVLNIGTQGGPTDGTSDLCRKIDETVGPDKPGLIFVTGPGDDGGRPTRARGTVKQGENLTLKIKVELPKGAKETVKPGARIDLWYPDTDRIDVSIRMPTGKHGPYAAPRGDNDRVTEDTGEFALYHNAGRTRFKAPTNSKRELMVDLKSGVGEYSIILHGKEVKSGRFDATLNDFNPGYHGPSPLLNPLASTRFLNYVAPGSICDAATARHNICPGDYVIRNDTLDLDGRRHNRTGEGLVGELWKGSSVGPTFDGRLGVDFCVPADSVYTTYNPKSAWAQARWNLAHDGKGLYGNASAVSAANPMTTGIIALMLQLDPHLDALTAKKILQKATRADKFTGKVPNPNWGYGKLDVYTALKLTKENAAKRKALTLRRSARASGRR